MKEPGSEHTEGGGVGDSPQSMGLTSKCRCGSVGLYAKGCCRCRIPHGFEGKLDKYLEKY